MARRSALRADSAAMLANPARGRTRYALRAALKQPPRVRSRSRPVLRQACGRVRCASRRLANRPRQAIPRARTPGARSAGMRVVGFRWRFEVIAGVMPLQQRCLRRVSLLQGCAGLRQAQPERFGAVTRTRLRLFASSRLAPRSSLLAPRSSLLAFSRSRVLVFSCHCVTASLRHCVSAGVQHRRSIPVRAGAGTVVCACEAPRSAACPAAGLPKDRPAS